MMDTGEFMKPGDIIKLPNGTYGEITCAYSSYQYKVSRREKFERFVRRVRYFVRWGIRQRVGNLIIDIGHYIRHGERML